MDAGFGLPQEQVWRVTDVPGDDERSQQADEGRSRGIRAVGFRMLAKVVAWLGTPDAVMASLGLLDDDAKPQIPYDTWNQMEDAFVERRPYGKDTTSYTLAPRSSNEVRIRLFEMSRKDKHRAKAAAVLLAQIEVWRLEHGRPLGEPRNVGIETESAGPTVTVDELQPDSIKAS